MKNFAQMCETLADNNKISRICIFDFDGTLVNTPLRPEGWTKGWYGRKESLLPPFMPHAHNIPNEGMHLLNKKVYDEYMKCLNRNDTLTVFMTGRHMGLKWLVMKILDAYGINPEEKMNQRAIFVSGDKTLPTKLNNIKNMALEFPNANVIEIWEDRPEHVEEFKNYEKQLKEIRDSISVVVHEPPNWE